jgi:hypothetical protein
MATTYNWTISSLECYPEKAGKEKVVFTVHWRYSAADGNYFSETYGSHSLDTDNIKKFVSFENLTKETVVGWLESSLGEEKIDEMKQTLLNGINEQKNPPVVRPPLPWNLVPPTE